VKRTSIQQRMTKHINDLDSADENVSARAEGYLIRYYGAKALEPLIVACSHSNPQVRFRSAWILGHTHDPRAFDPLLRLTQG
jgi:HEAT repeat protein